MLRFVGTNSDGLPLKRKQSQRACEACRKRKKRCEHLITSDSGEDSQSWQAQNSTEVPIDDLQSPMTVSSLGGTNNHVLLQSPSLSRISNARPLEHHANTIADQHSTHRVQIIDHDTDGDDEPQFIGDLNPEGIFLAGTSPATTSGSAEDSAGVWLQQRALNGATSQLLRLPFSHRHLSSIYSPDPLISRVLLPHLERECLRLLPPRTDFEALRRIYLDEVHPLFPVLDIDALSSTSESSPVNILLRQAVCLAASTSLRAKSHLNLALSGQDTTLQLPKDFVTQLSLALRTSVDLGLVKDKLILIQILAILSLFTQLSEDRHSSAEFASRAISYIHTTGLHLDTQKNRKDHGYVTRLFCCIWALDRLNAAFHGRPVLMHERDYGRSIDECFRAQEAAFQLLLRIVLVLDKVIALYRPTSEENKESWELNFPSFDELLNQSGAVRVNSHLLATVETLYHAVAMLSCRSQSLKEPARSSTSYVRQTLSAVSIVSIVGTEFRGQLSMLPVVPYAVSLSLRVSYRELRLSKMPFVRARSRRQLLTTCELLRELGEVFSSAMLMVDLAEQTVREMDKVFSTMINAQNQGSSAVQQVTVPNNPITRLGQYQQEGREVDLSANSTGAVRGHQQLATSNQISVEEDQNFINFDPDMFNLMPDLDIFDHFDPDFNLEAIDAALGDNIAPSFPHSLFEFER